jgi:hypothetical protein
MSIEPTNPETLDKNHGRRSFLAHSVAFGIGTSLTTKGIGASSMETIECKPSAADALILYLDLLIQVQAVAFLDASRGLISATKNCSTTLDDLYRKVDLLETEMRAHPRSAAKTEHLRHVVGWGKGQANFLKAAANLPPDGALPVAAMVTVGQQIYRAAQDLKASADITLSRKAQELLEDIMKTVKDFREVPDETERAAEEYQLKLTEIRKAIAAIRNDLFAASMSAADAEMADSDEKRKAAKTETLNKLDSVIGRLQTLKAGSSQPHLNTLTQDSVPATDLLIAMIQGTKQVIENPAIVQLADKPPRGQVRFLTASLGSSGSMPVSLFSRVQQAIENHCPRGTTMRTLWVSNLILGAMAYPDQNARVPLIAGVLIFFPCWSGDKKALASALARL